MKRLSTALLAAALPLLPAYAEGDDFGIWTSAGIQKSLSQKFSFDASIGFRAEDCLKRVARWDVGAGVSYKPLKYLSLSAGYTFIYGQNGEESKTDYKKKTDEDGNPIFNGYNVDHAYWRSRHRATFDVMGKLPLGRFTLSLRERYQYTHYNAATTTRDRYRSELPEAMADTWTGDAYRYGGHTFTSLEQVERNKKAKNRHYLRSRLTLDYNIRHCPLTPYAAYEFHNNLSDAMKLKKSRLTAGVEWKVSKQHRLDFAYVFQNSHDDDNEGNLHALSVEYKFKF